MEKDKQTNNQQQSNNPQPPKPRRWLSIILYTIAFAVMAYFFFGQAPTKGISYTKLVSYIEVGAVEKIEVSGDLQAQAKVQPQQYTLVFGSQGDGERVKGMLNSQVPSMDEFSKYIDGVNEARKAKNQAAIDVT